MKRTTKTALSILTALVMILMLTVPVLAAPVGEADAPQGGTGTRPSSGEANISSDGDLDVDGTWNTVGDDAVGDTAGSEKSNADINVWAKVIEDIPEYETYCVDIDWGYMKFEFNAGVQEWDPDTHTYVGIADGVWTTSFVNGTNNRVIVNNHSSAAIDAAFAYTMNGTAFNDVAGAKNVIGKFYNGNTAALTNAIATPDTLVGNANPTRNLAGGVPANYTADSADAILSDAAGTLKPAFDNVGVVYFAFSGTPDAHRADTLTDFTKVGKITVTISPEA